MGLAVRLFKTSMSRPQWKIFELSNLKQTGQRLNRIFDWRCWCA